MKIFRLPDLGEGLAEAEIRQWYVSEGEEVQVDAPMLAVETAKAVVDVPAPRTGKIAKLHAKVGQILAIGAPLVEFTDGQDTKAATEDAGSVVGNLKITETTLDNEVVQRRERTAGTSQRVLPAARQAARRLGVDLTALIGSGPDGVITLSDVENAHGIQPSSAAPEGFEPLKGVRRAMASAMTLSRQQVCPATVIDEADISAWFHPGVNSAAQQDFSTRAVRAVVAACQAEPALNAWYDASSNARRLWPEVHLGLALDSAEGLFVPVIRNAQLLDGPQIRSTIDRFKRCLQDRSLPAEELRDPTLILSNFGSIAGQFATPVVVPPTVAILGIGRKKGSVLPLSLTFDHRAVTGGEAARFLAALIKDLSQA